MQSVLLLLPLPLPLLLPLSSHHPPLLQVASADFVSSHPSLLKALNCLPQLELVAVQGKEHQRCGLCYHGSDRHSQFKRLLLQGELLADACWLCA